MSETDLRARAKELAIFLGSQHFGYYDQPYVLVDSDVDALLAAFEAIRAEQIEADARIAEAVWPKYFANEDVAISVLADVAKGIRGQDADIGYRESERDGR